MSVGTVRENRGSAESVKKAKCRGEGRESSERTRKGATMNDDDIDPWLSIEGEHSFFFLSLAIARSLYLFLSLSSSNEREASTHPSRLAFTRKRDPHALQSTGLSGGPLRQQHETDVRQWRHGPPSLATAGALGAAAVAIVVGSPTPRIVVFLFGLCTELSEKEEEEQRRSEASGAMKH